jgi:hypothetical protein
MTTTVQGIGGDGGPDEAFPEKLQLSKSKKKIQRTNLMENMNENPELDELEGDALLDAEDTIDEFSDADEFDTADMEAEEVIEVDDEGAVDLKVGDKIVTISSEDAEDNSEEEEYDDAADAGEDMEEMGELEDGSIESYMEGFVKSLGDGPAQSPVHNIDQAKQHQPAKHNSNGKNDENNSSPVESEEDARQHAQTEKASKRDIDESPKGPAVKKDKAQSPVHDIKGARQHSMGQGMVDDMPQDDGQVSSVKNDGKQTHEKIAPKHLSYEGFMAKADGLFTETFDQNFRKAGKKKK